MSVWPMILDLKIVATERERPIHLWLPLFLLWPLVLALGVIALVLTILADIVLLLVGRPYHHYTFLLLRSLAALTETRGMVIRVKDDKAAVDMTVQ
jgi:hypothetical protein